MPRTAVPDPVLVAGRGRRMWMFPDGTMLPVISGGDGPEDPPPAGDGTPPPAPPAPAGDGTPPAPAEGADTPLGPEGEKALGAWKGRAKEAEAEAKRLREENETLRLAQLSDQERELERIKAETRESARNEVLGQVTPKLFISELKAATAGALLPAAAADLLVNPMVAQRLLGLAEIPVTADGDIDGEAISQAVTAYVAARPHLASSATQTPGPVDQGARQTPPAKTLDERIAEAEASGNWKLSGQLKTQRMLSA